MALLAGGAILAGAVVLSNERETVQPQAPQPRQAPVPSVRVDGRVETESNKGLLDSLVGVAQILAFLAAAFGARLVYRQMQNDRSETRVERSLSFLQRYLGREFGRMIAPSLRYLWASNTNECIVQLRAWKSAPHAEEACLPGATSKPSAPLACQNDVIHLLDFFEELGAAYNRRLIDRNVVHRTIATAPVQILAIAWWFIVWNRDGRPIAALEPEESRLTRLKRRMITLVRAEGPPPGPSEDKSRTWVEFEHMVRRVHLARPDLKEKHKPSRSIRLLAWPAGNEADAEDWDSSGRLSDALSDQVAVIGLERLHEWVREFVERRCVRLSSSQMRVLAIPDMDTDPGAWKEELEFATKLEACLLRLDQAGVEALIERLGGRVGTGAQKPAIGARSLSAPGVVSWPEWSPGDGARGNT